MEKKVFSDTLIIAQLLSSFNSISTPQDHYCGGHSGQLNPAPIITHYFVIHFYYSILCSSLKLSFSHDFPD